MECGVLYDSGGYGTSCFNMTDDIMFNEFESSDKVIIKTKNSLYRFSIENPSERQGVLTGGKFGDSPRRAVLIESLVESGGGVWSDMMGLKVGARALFYLQSPTGLERVVTSEITELTVVKKNHSRHSVS
jgi:hypothetical protein